MGGRGGGVKVPEHAGKDEEKKKYIAQLLFFILTAASRSAGRPADLLLSTTFKHNLVTAFK